MIAMYEFKPLSIEKTNNLLKEFGVENINKELSITDIYNYKQKEYSNVEERKIGFKK